MGFLKNLFGTLREAAKAGGQFNPALEDVMGKVEALHAQGKLSDVVYQAEQSYLKEHAEYKAKGAHTDAADSETDMAALKHLMAVLQSEQTKLDPSIQEEVGQLLSMRDSMENILSKLNLDGLAKK